jgi:DNA replication protein DnaC
MDELPKKLDASTDSKADSCATHGEFVSTAFKFGERVMHWSGCPECRRIDSEKMTADAAQAEAKERQARLEVRLNKSGIPVRYRSKDFASYVASSDKQEKALSIAMEFAGNFKRHADAGTVVVFSGLPGTGKSHLATAIAQEVMKAETVLYTSAIDAVRMVRDTWRRDSARTESQVLQELSSLGLLILDEVGVQYGSEAEQVTLFDIIDKRYRDLMPTILLTNLNKTGMKTFLGDRSFDRLREGGIWLTFDWDSQRGKAAA